MNLRGTKWEPQARPGYWMRTFTNKHYWPLDPRPEEVDIVDIAHHLSQLCRYTGATPRFYSVAEHSYLMSFAVPREHQLCALLHDATEAYLGDIGRPLKYANGMEGYKIIEKLNWERAIAPAFGLPLKQPEIIKKLDMAMLHVEMKAMNMDINLAIADTEMSVDSLPDIEINNWPPESAEMLFLQRYYDLVKHAPDNVSGSAPCTIRADSGISSFPSAAAAAISTDGGAPAE